MLVQAIFRCFRQALEWRRHGREIGRPRALAQLTEATQAARHRGVSMGRILGALPVVVWLLASSAPLARAAADAGVSTADAGATPAYAVELQRQAEHVRAFLKGELELELEPQSLFDVALDASDQRLQVEQRRVRTLLARESAAPADAQSSGPVLERAASAALANAEVLDERVWRAQLQIERARLPFYALPSSERAKLVRRHAERREKAKSLDHEQALGAAERAAREALTREHEALEAARLASTEAARLINEEYARLLAVTRQQAELETSLIQRRAALDARNEVALGWRRRVADLATSARLDAEARAQADSTVAGALK